MLSGTSGIYIYIYIIISLSISRRQSSQNVLTVIHLHYDKFLCIPF